MISMETDTTKLVRNVSDIINVFADRCNSHIQAPTIKLYSSNVCTTFICRLFQIENGILLICSIKVFIKRINQKRILPATVASTLITDTQSNRISPYSINPERGTTSKL